MEKTPKTYKSYKIGCIRSEIILKDPFDNTCVDRKLMDSQMISHFDYLDEHGVSIYGQFSQTFRKYEFRRIVEETIIQAFQDYKNSRDPTNKLIFLRPRELKKANLSEINVLFNRLAVEYSLEFQNFITDFIKKQFIYMKKAEPFLQEIEKQFEHVLGQIKKNNEKEEINALKIETDENKNKKEEEEIEEKEEKEEEKEKENDDENDYSDEINIINENTFFDHNENNEYFNANDDYFTNDQY